MDMEMEIDPEIAAQMGFSFFGGASKKRKFNPDDAFTGATASKANAVPVADARPRKAEDAPAADNTRDDLVLPDGTTVNLQALRRGVRNERGDTAYFLPSFLEDPWEKLKSKST